MLAVPPMTVTNVDEIQQELGTYALPDCYNLPPVKSWEAALDYEFYAEQMDCPAYHNLAAEVKLGNEFLLDIKENMDYLTKYFNKELDETTSYEIDEMTLMCENII